MHENGSVNPLPPFPRGTERALNLHTSLHKEIILIQILLSNQGKQMTKDLFDGVRCKSRVGVR